MVKQFTILNNIIILKGNNAIFFRRIERILSSFMQASNFNEKHRRTISIKIRNNNLFVNVEKECCYSNLSLTDIYPVIYSVLYYIFSLDELICVHSVVLAKGNKCIMIMGHFNSGKTTLANSLAAQGWIIISGDQSIIKNINNDLWIIAGSKYNCYNGSETLLSVDFQLLKLTAIFYVKGVCTNGLPMVKRVTDFNNVERCAWESFFWPWNTLLIKHNLLIDNYRNDYIKFIKDKLTILQDIPFYHVRGDAFKVSNSINDLQQKEIESL